MASSQALNLRSLLIGARGKSRSRHLVNCAYEFFRKVLVTLMSFRLSMGALVWSATCFVSKMKSVTHAIHSVAVQTTRPYSAHANASVEARMFRQAGRTEQKRPLVLH